MDDVLRHYSHIREKSLSECSLPSETLLIMIPDTKEFQYQKSILIQIVATINHFLGGPVTFFFLRLKNHIVIITTPNSSYYEFIPPKLFIFCCSYSYFCVVCRLLVTLRGEDLLRSSSFNPTTNLNQKPKWSGQNFPTHSGNEFDCSGCGPTVWCGVLSGQRLVPVAFLRLICYATWRFVWFAEFFRCGFPEGSQRVLNDVFFVGIWFDRWCDGHSFGSNVVSRVEGFFESHVTYGRKPSELICPK